MTQSPYNDILNELQYYILNEYNINRYLDKKIKCVIKEKQTIIQCQKKIKNQIFVPTENDTLFWCFYIFKNGDSKYELMYNKNDIVARQIKIEYIDKIRKNKQTVKTYKFDSICNIESNLANDKSLNVKTFLTLCAIENMNILFIKNKTYYELYMNDSKSVYVVYCLNNKENKNYIGRYGFEINSTETVDNIKKSLYKIENVDKPIKSFSSYKVSDLIDICNKLAIEIKNEETGKNKSKNELYELIIQYF
jgi:hypothetical protein